MPRDMFGDVTNPSIKVGSQKWYTVPVSILAHIVLFAARHHHSLDGGRRAADAADDDGVRRRATAAATATAAAAGAGASRSRSRCEVVNPECRADRGAQGNQA